MKIPCILTLLGISIWAGSARAASYDCPAKINVQQSASSVPDGWNSFHDQDLYPLTNVSLSEGEPSKRVTLVPTGDRKKGKTSVTTWVFTPSSDGYWLSCLYSGTSIGMTRKLPDGTKSCRVEGDARFDPPSPTKIECQ